MLFQYTWEKVLRGEKTQTRRIVKPGEHFNEMGATTIVTGSFFRQMTFADDYHYAVITPAGRIKWEVGKTYAVQPGRGQPAVGRIRITAIRKERIGDITEEDAIAEGFSAGGRGRGLPGMGLGAYMARTHFFDAIREINKLQTDPFYLEIKVWVLEFERIPDPEPA
jgi:hypothetical protein